MPPAILAALGSILLLAPAGVVEVSDTARVSARYVQLGDRTAMDLDDLPRLALRLDWPLVTLETQYAPRFAWLDVLARDSPSLIVLHTARLSAALRQPRYSLSLAQAVALGDVDFGRAGSVAGDPQASLTGETIAAPASATMSANASAPAAGATSTAPVMPASTSPGAPASTILPTSIDLVPAVEVVRVASSTTSLGLHYFWAPAWSSSFDVGFVQSGGADARAQTLLPRQRSLRLSTSLAYQLTRNDVLDTRVSGTQTDTSNGYQHALGMLEESWTRRLSRALSSNVGAGLAYQSTLLDGAVEAQGWSPTLHAGLAYALLTRDVQAHLDWNVGAAPQVNGVLGTLQNRVQSTTRAVVTLSRTTLGASLDFVQTLPTTDPGAARLIIAGVTGDQQLLDWLFFDAGARILWQRFNVTVATMQSLWVLYVGLTGHAPKLAF